VAEGLRTRIAPTPSGFLHAGNAVNFLITHELARAARGTLLLRIDDLDAERARPEYLDDIFRSLEWLGIDWDEGPTGPEDFLRNWSQRSRIERYSELLLGLRKGGHLYACECSRKAVPGLHLC
jgi:glutamyl-tRNA synthetase